MSLENKNLHTEVLTPDYNLSSVRGYPLDHWGDRLIGHYLGRILSQKTVGQARGQQDMPEASQRSQQSHEYARKQQAKQARIKQSKPGEQRLARDARAAS